MGKKFLVNRWIPHNLSEANKALRKTICEDLLTQVNKNDFLMRLITVDEIWVYWKNSQRPYLNRAWATPGGDGITAVRRSSMTPHKHLASVFWDARGVLFVDVLPSGVSLNSKIYCDQLDRLRDCIQVKRRRTNLNDFFSFA